MSLLEYQTHRHKEKDDVPPAAAAIPIDPYASASVRHLNLTERQQEMRRHITEKVWANLLIREAVSELGSYSPWVYGHTMRVRDGATALAIVAGESEHAIELANAGALMHDVGKGHESLLGLLAISTKFTGAQRETMKQHALYGMEKVASLGLGRNLEQTVGSVHTFKREEPYPPDFRFEAQPFSDGTVPDMMRIGGILALFDAYDAGQSDRPYSSIESREETLRHLEDNLDVDPSLLTLLDELTRPPGA